MRLRLWLVRSAVVACALSSSAWAQDPGQGRQQGRQQGQQGQVMYGGGLYDNQKLEDDWFYDSYSTKKGFGADYYAKDNLIGSFDQKVDTDDWFFDQYELIEGTTGGRMGDGQIGTPRPGEGMQGGGRNVQGGTDGVQGGTDGVQQGQQGRQGQQGQMKEQIQGQIEAFKQVDVVGTDQSHLVVLLSEGDNRYVVDLGPSQALEDLQINEGEQLSVEGNIGRVGDRAVLFANKLTWQNQDVNIRQDLQLKSEPIPREPSRQQDITGEILKLKEVTTEAGRTHTVALLQSPDDMQMVVDLGPSDNFQKFDYAEGDNIHVFGRTMPIGEHLVLWADQIEYQGENVDLRGGAQQQPRGRQGGGPRGRGTR